jgi:hypothetical protein
MQEGGLEITAAEELGYLPMLQCWRCISSRARLTFERNEGYE